MIKFKTYGQFILEHGDEDGADDMFKVYIILGPNTTENGEFTYRGYATDNFFKELKEDSENINQKYPILNYNNPMTLMLIDEGKINPDNVYNLPEHTKNSGSKEKFHKMIREDENL